MSDTTTTAKLGALRHRLAQALDDSEHVVNEDYVESIEPPCYLIGWGAPMLEPMTGCIYEVRPAVLAVAGRINLSAGQAVLEDLIENALPRLRKIGPIDRVDQPVHLDIAGISYLAARITLRSTITL